MKKAASVRDPGVCVVCLWLDLVRTYPKPATFRKGNLILCLCKTHWAMLGKRKRKRPRGEKRKGTTKATAR